jgi:hypothetical protein
MKEAFTNIKFVSDSFSSVSIAGVFALLVASKNRWALRHFARMPICLCSASSITIVAWGGRPCERYFGFVPFSLSAEMVGGDIGKILGQKQVFGRHIRY